jgi:hypothetical protein
MNWTAGFPLARVGTSISDAYVFIRYTKYTRPHPAPLSPIVRRVVWLRCAGHHRNRDREWAEWVHTTLWHTTPKLTQRH